MIYTTSFLKEFQAATGELTFANNIPKIKAELTGIVEQPVDFENMPFEALQMKKMQ